MADTFSVRLPPEQTKFLDKMAQDTNRSRNKLVSNAVALMQRDYEFVMKKLADGDRDFAEGKVLSHAEVTQRAEALLNRLDVKTDV